jgi:flavin reductase (DIM6/NTAB) family NADH-FMN oxidoreductase RutF
MHLQLLHLQVLSLTKIKKTSDRGRPATETQGAASMAPDGFKAEFRKAMRRLTGTVTVITTAHEGRRYGMTATAVTSVSADPPSLLICINRAASLHEPLIRAGRYCVNILQAGQTDVAQAFSGGVPQDLRFCQGDWREDTTGLPFLRDAQANIFCDADAMASYGTHSIIIGKVSDVLVAGRVTPLLYQDGQYTVGLGEGVDWVVPLAG